MQRYKLHYIWIFAILFSCSGEDPAPSNSVLVSAESVSTRSAAELQVFLAASGADLPVSKLKYDVERYKVVYKTEYMGESINASALVILPKNPTGSVPMISFQHGTISSHAEAPTELPASDEQLILYTALSSPGFITVIPDFIGFGASKSLLHPYYVEDATASAIMDALAAAKELAAQKSVSFNSKLFLAGYSQGGYATMATHKYIETEQPEGYDLVASFPAAGGYDVKSMQTYFFGLETYDQPFYIAFVAEAYKTFYEWSQPLTDMFNDPYASRIPGLLDGSKTSSDINAQLTDNMHDLLTADILANIETNSKYTEFVSALNENSLTDWAPKKPIFMYHGDEDGTVPYENSEITLEKLTANGSTSVTLTTLPGANHSTGVIPYVELFLPKLLDMGIE